MRIRWFALFQTILPHRLIGRVCHFFTHIEIPLISSWLVKTYRHCYQLDLSEAQSPNPQDYPSLAKLFTRALKPNARPISQENHQLISPADGKISAYGTVDNHSRLTIKDQDYTLEALLAQKPDIAYNQYAIIYLAPHNYHRVHMPIDGTLTSLRYVPGRSFSVNPTSQRDVTGLFARNERVITEFSTSYGPMAMIWVGALIVGGITIHPKGLIAPKNLSQVQDLSIEPQDLCKGDELGYFTFGSSIALLLKGDLTWQNIPQSAEEIKYGQAIAQFASTAENRHTNHF